MVCFDALPRRLRREGHQNKHKQTRSIAPPGDLRQSALGSGDRPLAAVHAAAAFTHEPHGPPLTPAAMDVHLHHHPLSSSFGIQSSASSASEEDLPGEAITWKKILDLSFHFGVGKLFLKFWCWNGATAISGICQFPLLLAPGSTYMIPVHSRLRELTGAFVERLPGRWTDSDSLGPCAPPSVATTSIAPRFFCPILVLAVVFSLRLRLWSQ